MYSGEVSYCQAAALGIWTPETQLTILTFAGDCSIGHAPRARREDRSIESNVFAKSIIASLPSGIIGISLDGQIVTVNEAASLILDLPAPSELIGHSCRDALAAWPDLARLLLDSSETRSAVNRAEIDLRAEQTRARTIGYTLSPVRERSGTVIGAVIVFKDLTRIERLEEQERLKDRLAVLGQMAAGLAHELRNPLAAIEIHAGLLRRAIDPSLAMYTESLDHILREVRRLNETVITSLEYVRPVEVLDQRIPLEPLLDAVVGEAAAGTARIVREYAREGTFTLGDPVQLRQVFSNLVCNAREAAGVDGHVLLRTWVTDRKRTAQRHGVEDGRPLIREGFDTSDSEEEPQVVVEVEDDGPGIPPEYQSRVFHPFFTTKPKGSGLGLAMVQKVVQSHRGRIDFVTAPGRGTTFRVVLRAAPQEPA